MQADLTILVNTSDNFEDCWEPFFKLFKKYWPDCPYPIVLNTEHKDYHYPGLNIRAAKVAEGQSTRLSWSACLAKCLEHIETPYIFYLQEDYFLERPVDEKHFEALMQFMRAGQADVIRVMECGGAGPWKPSQLSPLLWEVDQKAKYRISLQAALWKTSTLSSHVRLHESPWQLEGFGSARARRKKERVFCVNRDMFSHPEKEIFPYTPTGVVAGRWEKHVVEPLFAREGINMDFSKRGFYINGLHPRKKAHIFKRITDRIRSLI